MQEPTQGKPVFRLGLIRIIIRNSGLGNAVIAFLGIFFLSAVLIRLLDPGFNRLGDALWYCFEAVTTIGFGDLVITSVAGRVVTVMLSIVSIFFLAILTGTVVSYCVEFMKAHLDKSLALYIHKLEHLPELSPEELASLSKSIKELGKWGRG